MIFAVFHHTWITVENLGLIHATRLWFFVRRVFWDELSRRSGAGGVVIFCLENATALLEKPRGKKFSFC